MAPVCAIPTTTVVKDDRRDQHPHQLDKPVAERLHGRPVLRGEVSEQRARGDTDEYLDVQAWNAA
jgi:hypothetical protein